MNKPYAALLAAAVLAAITVANAAEQGERDADDAEPPAHASEAAADSGKPEAEARMAAEIRETHGDEPLAVAGDPEAGKSKAAACAACHGQDGNSPSPEWPKLAGQHPGYIVAQLKQYQSGERQNAIMQGMAASLSEQDMRDIAAYYARQTIKPGVADESLVEQGEILYRRGDKEAGVPACIACHGPTGSGIPATVYPAIGGQHAEYVFNQLKLYASGERQGDSDIMNRVAERLDEDDMRAVSSYVEGLHTREGAFDVGR